MNPRRDVRHDDLHERGECRMRMDSAAIQTQDAFSVERAQSDNAFFCRLPRAASRVSSSGFALVAALFLIVVVAALGLFAMRIGMGQQQTVNLALLSARALSAANSGIEFGAYRALAGNCASTTLNLTEAGLTGFTVDVTCAPADHADAGGTTTIYRVEALASYGVYGTPDFVSRRVYATFASTP